MGRLKGRLGSVPCRQHSTRLCSPGIKVCISVGTWHEGMQVVVPVRAGGSKGRSLANSNLKPPSRKEMLDCSSEGKP